MDKDQLYKYMAKKLRHYRELKNVSQEIAAEYVGLTRTSICNIESGKHSTTPECIFSLCCLYGIQPADIFPFAVPIKFTVQEALVPVTKMKKQRILVIEKQQQDGSTTENTV